MKLIAIIMIAAALTGCVQTIVCGSDNQLYQVDANRSTKDLRAINQVCTLNPDGSFTVKNK